jgi:hypothetical protein
MSALDLGRVKGLWRGVIDLQHTVEAAVGGPPPTIASACFSSSFLLSASGTMEATSCTARSRSAECSVRVIAAESPTLISSIVLLGASLQFRRCLSNKPTLKTAVVFRSFTPPRRYAPPKHRAGLVPSCGVEGSLDHGPALAFQIRQDLVRGHFLDQQE